MKIKLGLCFVLVSALTSVAQTTNPTPAQLKLRLFDGGVFVEHSAIVGRTYRLEESTTLTNWSLLVERVADATNLSFYFENPNITLIAPTNTSTNDPGPVPSPTGPQSMSSGTTASPSKSPKLKSAPLPYPWEEAYTPQPRDSSMTANASTQMQTVSSAESGGTPEAKSYRVVAPDDRIQFPNWMPFVDQYMSFDVWTSITGGTYRMELYRDGVGVFTNVALVPAGGNFHVHDPGYNSADWPFTDYYDAGEWELRVTVTPPPSLEGEAPALATVKKKQRRPGNSGVRRGVTANMAGDQIFGVDDWAAVEEDFTATFETTFLACSNYSLKSCCTGKFGCYIARPLSRMGGAGRLTNFRNLFFVWQDNAFAFD